MWTMVEVGILQPACSCTGLCTFLTLVYTTWPWNDTGMTMGRRHCACLAMRLQVCRTLKPATGSQLAVAADLRQQFRTC
jgi:hypothetical protein